MATILQGPTDYGGISIKPPNVNRNRNNPPSSAFAPPIVPTVTTPSDSLAGQTFAPLLDSLHGIGRPTIAPFAPIAPRFEGQAPVATVRPDNSYYQNLFDAKFSPLNQDTFGAGGTSDQAVGAINRRGFLTAGPSGVAGQIYDKTVTSPFARAVTDIQNQVNIIKTETEMDLAKYDSTRQDDFRKFQSDLILKDRDYGVASVEAQSRIDNTYLSLESEINQAIATGATNEKIAELNARINTFQSLVAAETARAQLDQQAAQEAARLQEERLNRQGDWYNTATSTAGGLAPTVPYDALDVPRPVATDKNGNVSGQTTYSTPGVGTGSNGTPIRMENPGSNGAPNREGFDGEKAAGSDGRIWTYNHQRQMWQSS